MDAKTRTGLDRIGQAWPRRLNGARAGLLVHPASINSRFLHASDIFLKLPRTILSALFGPQHGIRGETQDNMIEWEGYRDRGRNVPVFSLYGKTRKPDKKMLRNIDVMVVDLQDVGARYYTFIWTLALVMESCMAESKAMVVLDRPNPIGGKLIEGPVLNPAFRSFVGLHPLPVRHGMTVGEIACYLKDLFYKTLNLYVVPMKGWKRAMWFEDTGLPWVLPSPNMPTNETATVYPGMCLLEGTNLSEGRGTTRPFEIFGAPFVDQDILAKELTALRLPGVVFRALSFQPAFQKYAGEICGGAQIHVMDRKTFKPFMTAVGILKTIRDLYPTKFLWKSPPYEYEQTLLPIDILAGSSRVREDIDNGVSLRHMESWWNAELTAFNKIFRRKYLLYH